MKRLEEFQPEDWIAEFREQAEFEFRKIDYHIIELKVGKTTVAKFYGKLREFPYDPASSPMDEVAIVTHGEYQIPTKTIDEIHEMAQKSYFYLRPLFLAITDKLPVLQIQGIKHLIIWPGQLTNYGDIATRRR